MCREGEREREKAEKESDTNPNCKKNSFFLSSFLKTNRFVAAPLLPPAAALSFG